MLLSVIVPTHRSGRRLDLMLGSLSESFEEGAELIVVDDGRTEVWDRAEAIGARVIGIPHSGRSIARNRGAQVARASRLLFLDADVIVGSSVLRTHLEYAARASSAIARGAIHHLPWLAPFEDPIDGTLIQPPQAEQPGTPAGGMLMTRTLQLDERGRPCVESLRRSRVSRFERDVECWLTQIGPLGAGRWVGVAGGHVSIPCDVFRELGGFDERMGLRWGAEDLEFGLRSEQRGIPIEYTSGAVVHHMDRIQPPRRRDHQAALEYVAAKHNRPSVLRLMEYFDGKLSLEDVAAGS